VTAFVAGLYSVLAAVLAIPLLKERLEIPTLVALIAALLGTLLLSDLELGDESVWGIGIALVAAMAFGLFPSCPAAGPRAMGCRARRSVWRPSRSAASSPFVLLGERLSTVQLIGAACVLLAIAVAGGLLSRARPQANGGPT